MKADDPDKDNLITVDDAAAKLGVSRATLYSRLRAAEIAPKRLLGDKRSHISPSDMQTIAQRSRGREVSRRRLLTTSARLGAGLFAAVALGRESAEATKPAMAALDRVEGDDELVERSSRQLLASSLEADYQPGQAHPLFPERPHPDDLTALVSVAGPAGLYAFLQQKMVDIVDHLPADLSRNLVLFGSPKSEAISRRIFQYEVDDGNTDHLRRIRSPAIPLAYDWVLSEKQLQDSGVDPSQLRTTRLIGGEQITLPNWSIRDAEGNRLLVPKVVGGELASDFLVVTRLRNFLDKKAFDSGKFVVSWAGAHGVGTKAAALLLRDRAMLSDLARKLEAFDELQILVEVLSVKRGSYGYEPIEIVVRDFVPLPVLASDYAAAEDYLKGVVPDAEADASPSPTTTAANRVPEDGL